MNDTDNSIVWTDSTGADHIERFPTASMLIIRAEELEAAGFKVYT